MKADVYQIFLLPIKFGNCCFCGVSEAPALSSTSACCSSCAEDWCRYSCDHTCPTAPQTWHFCSLLAALNCRYQGKNWNQTSLGRCSLLLSLLRAAQGPWPHFAIGFPEYLLTLAPHSRSLKLTDSLPTSPHQNPVLEELNPHTPAAANGSCSKSSAIMKIQPSAALLGMEMAYPVMNMKIPGSGSGL